MTSITIKKTFIFLLGLWLFASTALVYALTLEDKSAHAVVSMGSGLVLAWVFGLGPIMYFFRERIAAFVLSIRLDWQVKFVVFATFLALVEEAIATTLTNLAPLFGVSVGQAYITASANYFDVILHHSVVVFIPMFIAWAWALARWDFDPFWVFLLFGLTGLLAETVSFGTQNLFQFAMWIFVYGLMVFLPAFSLPNSRGAKKPSFWHGLVAVILPIIFAVPWVFIVKLLSSNHPDIHFPPIQT